MQKSDQQLVKLDKSNIYNENQQQNAQKDSKKENQNIRALRFKERKSKHKNTKYYRIIAETYE